MEVDLQESRVVEVGGCKTVGSNLLPHTPARPSPPASQPASASQCQPDHGRGYVRCRRWSRTQYHSAFLFLLPRPPEYVPSSPFKPSCKLQVASYMHHPDTPLAPFANHQGLDTPQSPRRQAKSLARPPSSNKHPLHSLLIPPLFFPYFFHHLPLPISTQPLRTLPYLATSPSHIHQTHHTYQQPILLEPYPTPIQTPFKVINQHHNSIKRTRRLFSYSSLAPDCTLHKRTIG
jgi:hypothetical protein